MRNPWAVTYWISFRRRNILLPVDSWGRTDSEYVLSNRLAQLSEQRTTVLYICVVFCDIRYGFSVSHFLFEGVDFKIDIYTPFDSPCEGLHFTLFVFENSTTSLFRLMSAWMPTVWFRIWYYFWVKVLTEQRKPRNTAKTVRVFENP